MPTAVAGRAFLDAKTSEGGLEGGWGGDDRHSSAHGSNPALIRAEGWNPLPGYGGSPLPGGKDHTTRVAFSLRPNVPTLSMGTEHADLASKVVPDEVHV